MIHVATLLPENLVARLDAHVERMRRVNPGLRLTRSDAVRVLLHSALDREEQQAATGTGGRDGQA